MPDFSSNSILEHRLEARLANLTEKVNLLIGLDRDRATLMEMIVQEIDTTQEKQVVALEFADGNLKKKTAKLINILVSFTTQAVRKVKSIENRLKIQDERLSELESQMNKLSIK